jgi:hypothetical protein
VGVHKNCWGPGNLNLFGLSQPHLGRMYHVGHVESHFVPFGDGPSVGAR